MEFDLWVGRGVWYVQMQSNPSLPGTGGKELAAIVSHIHTDGTVNLLVIDAVGNTHARQHVAFKMPEGDAPSGDYARFPEPLEVMARQRQKAMQGIASLVSQQAQQALLFGTTPEGKFMAFEPATGIERPATDEEIEKYDLVAQKAKVDAGQVPTIDVNAAVDALRTGNADALAAAGITESNTVKVDEITPPPLSPPAEASNDASNPTPPEAA